MGGWRRWLLVGLAALVALIGVGYGALAASTSRSQLARAVLWGESDVGDHARFPARPVAAGPDRFQFPRPAGGSSVPPVRPVEVVEAGRLVRRDLEQFLSASDTTAFLILRGDTLLYEGYFNGYHRASTQTSMSVAKSVLGALVGIAIGQGRIGSVDDLITRYVPELAARDRRFDKVTLRHLLTMRSGLRYEEGGGPWVTTPPPTMPPTCASWPWREPRWSRRRAAGSTTTTSTPCWSGWPWSRRPAPRWLAYLEARLWRPLGMEADGSWSLDSQASGFEKMESGLNARAADFAKLGLLYARGGAWQGRQLISRAWVQESTVVPTGGGLIPAPRYGYFWWVQDDRSPPALFARGKYGQHLYVVPASDLVLVRFGRDFGYPHWPQLLSDLARRLDQATSSEAS